MKCDKAQEKISQHFDKQLKKDELKELKNHLADCDDCTELFQKMAKLDAQVNKLSFPFKKTKAEIVKSKPRLSYRVLVAGSSAIAVLVAVAIGLGNLSFFRDVKYSKIAPASNRAGRVEGYYGGSKSSYLPGDEDAGSSLNIFGDTTNADKESIGGEKKDTKASKELKLQLVQDIYLTLKVEKVKATYKKVTDIVEGNDGYVQSYNTNNVRTYEGIMSGASSIVVKVPASKLADIKKEIRNLGSVVSESVNTEDVSLAIVDLEANLRNYKRQENRYLELIDKANGINDLEHLEQELASIRQKIEQTQGQLRYQKSRVSMATLTISLVKKNTVVQKKGNWLVETFQNSINSFYSVVKVLIKALINLIPYLLIGAISYITYRRCRR